MNDADDRRLKARGGGWVGVAGLYVLVAFGSLLIAAAVLRLDLADLRMPFGYHGDSFPVAMVAKSVFDHGTHLHNPDLGAPVGADMHDFPFGGLAQIFVFRLLSLVCPDHWAVINVYFLLTFPATAITALFVSRQLGLSRAAGAVVSLLYVALPYHFLRGEFHLFLANYALIPLMVLIALRYGTGWRRPEHIQSKQDRTVLLAALGVCVLMGLTNVYYAFFTAMLLCLLALLHSLAERRWRPLLIAGLLSAGLAFGAAVDVAPTYVYAAVHGPNMVVAKRSPIESEINALKLTQMLLPVTNHRLEPLARLKAAYNRTIVPPGRQLPETDHASLGIAGIVGFVFLVGALLIRRSGIWGMRMLPPRMRGLPAFNLAAFLIGTVGSLGAFVALMVTPQIRAYNRIIVFIAFAALLAFGALLDRLRPVIYGRFREGRGQAAWGAACLLVLVAALLEQTSPEHTPNYRAICREFVSDRDFIRQVEATVPPGSMVFQLPYHPYPEHGPIGRMHDHQHFRQYLHSRYLKWSYGAMEGRRAADVQRALINRPLPEALKALHEAGFRAVTIDRAGYLDRAASPEDEIGRILGREPTVARDRTRAFFVL